MITILEVKESSINSKRMTVTLENGGYTGVYNISKELVDNGSLEACKPYFKKTGLLWVDRMCDENRNLDGIVNIIVGFGLGK